jgi:hypothetical protein
VWWVQVVVQPFDPIRWVQPTITRLQTLPNHLPHQTGSDRPWQKARSALGHGQHLLQRSIRRSSLKSNGFNLCVVG